MSLDFSYFRLSSNELLIELCDDFLKIDVSHCFSLCLRYYDHIVIYAHAQDARARRLIMIFRDGISDKGMDEIFMKDLEVAELYSGGVEFEITSAFRSHDKKCHGQGKAVDIACSDSHERMKILTGLTRAGFTRIGLYDRHIHADSCEGRPHWVLWLGVSR